MVCVCGVKVRRCECGWDISGAVGVVAEGQEADIYMKAGRGLVGRRGEGISREKI